MFLDQILVQLPQPLHVVGVDIDGEAIAEASKKFAHLHESIEFVQASCESLPFPDNSFDLVVMGNAIHLTDIKKVFSENYRVLKENGIFVANTAYEATRSIPPETKRIWGAFLSLARRYLQKIGYNVNHIPNPVNLEQYSAGDFHSTAIRAGFRKVEITFREVRMDAASVEAIANYGEFARGALPTVPVDIATTALKETVTPLFQRFKMTHIPRNWMFLVARK